MTQTRRKKILLADSDRSFIEAILSSDLSSMYAIAIATDGPSCLAQIEQWKPDLLIVDFMLPQMHGIELLHHAKKRSLGVILTDAVCMRQNYQCALLLGADYVARKPFSPQQLQIWVDAYFTHHLQAPPFPSAPKELPLPPEQQKDSATKGISYLKFWGTRGSNPVAGEEYTHFGGNTPCLEVRSGQDLVIIDAGSGIRPLGQVLSREAPDVLPILLSHTHWDHLLGFPFFYPIHQKNKTIRILAPVGFEKTTKELFTEMMAYAYFPVCLDEIQASLQFEDLRDGQKLSFGSIQIETHYAFHPGPTLCFKIHMQGQTIGYVTDNEFLLGTTSSLQEIARTPSLFAPYRSLIQFFEGCDILIHEAQYLPAEYAARIGWGHSCLYNASFLLQQARIAHWIVVHHDPRHTDAMLLQKHELHRKVLQDIGHHCHVEFAHDGMVLPIG